jgi:hypothetical protein
MLHKRVYSHMVSSSRSRLARSHCLHVSLAALGPVSCRNSFVYAHMHGVFYCTQKQAIYHPVTSRIYSHACLHTSISAYAHSHMHSLAVSLFISRFVVFNLFAHLTSLSLSLSLSFSLSHRHALSDQLLARGTFTHNTNKQTHTDKSISKGIPGGAHMHLNTDTQTPSAPRNSVGLPGSSTSGHSAQRSAAQGLVHVCSHPCVCFVEAEKLDHIMKKNALILIRTMLHANMRLVSS